MQDKMKLLFVDDERHILTALRALFRSQYEIFTANSGKEALEIIQREHIHVIISDQRMPKMLGSQLLAEVKKISPHTVRLLLTGYSDMGAIMKSINEGEVFRFITKPWDNDDIKAIISNATQVAQQANKEFSDEANRQVLAVRNNYTHTEETTSALEYPAVLIIDHFQDTQDTIHDLFQHERVILQANTIATAVELLHKHEVAVVIADTTIGNEDTTDFIKILKQEHPLVLSIILTMAMDSETAVGLINQGQIYRYLQKPVSRAVLKLSIQQAITQYARNQAKPWLLDRPKAESKRTLHNPTLAGRIRDSLRNLRHRFSGRTNLPALPPPQATSSSNTGSTSR